MCTARSLKFTLPINSPMGGMMTSANHPSDDLAEGGTDHHTDREVDDAAFHRKFFELGS